MWDRPSRLHTKPRSPTAQPGDAAAFKALNEAWIRRHFALEPSDERVLGDPMGEVIDRGGVILVGVTENEPIACIALIAMADGGFEIAKMAGREPWL